MVALSQTHNCLTTARTAAAVARVKITSAVPFDWHVLQPSGLGWLEYIEQSLKTRFTEYLSVP